MPASRATQDCNCPFLFVWEAQVHSISCMAPVPPGLLCTQDGCGHKVCERATAVRQRLLYITTWLCSNPKSMAPHHSHLGRYCFLGCCWPITGAYQRATPKCNALTCSICLKGKFHKRTSGHQASAAACWGPTVAPNCHHPSPTCCCMVALCSRVGPPLDLSTTPKMPSLLKNTRRPQTQVAVVGCAAECQLLLGMGVLAAASLAI